MAPSIAPGWRSFGATPTITCLCGLALLGLTSSHTRVAASETRNVDVLVLGAGMAGVRAGDVLARAGVDFLVLEQSHRLGGRMWNIDWAGRTIELGANWIEGIPQSEDVIWSIAQKIKLKGNYTTQEDDPVQPTLYTEDGKVPAADALKVQTKFNAAMFGALGVFCERHKQDASDLSLRDALTQAGWPVPSEQTPLERTLEFFVVDWDFEFPPEHVSIYNYFAVGKADSYHNLCNQSMATTTTRSTPGRMPNARTAARLGMLGGFPWESPRYFVTDKRGFAAVAEHVAGSFHGPNVSHSKVIFNASVASIKYTSADDSTGVEVTTAGGEVYRAAKVISTFSAGVINNAIKTKTMFVPPLPAWKTKAFDKAQNGIYTKIFLHFEKRFWEDADYVLYADKDPAKRGYYAVWQDLEATVGKFFPRTSNILMVTIVQQDSRRVEQQPHDATRKELLAVLGRMYGKGGALPKLIDMYIPIWEANPAFKGCWSNMAVNISDSDFDSMQRPVGGVHFAGEATDSDYNGFVMGGYSSGERAAHAVLGELGL